MSHLDGLAIAAEQVHAAEAERSEPHATSPGSVSTVTTDTPAKKKQKRNKPTLSCEECVERKTKCDRGRPACIACVKRSSQCRYSAIADIIVANNDNPRKAKRSKHIKTESIQSNNGDLTPISPQESVSTSAKRSASISSTGTSPYLLSYVAYSRQPPSTVFGLNSDHPFANYWTCQGGMTEIIGVLPSKDQADILVAKFFETVDPVYPMIDKRSFYADYERFWTYSVEQKQQVEPILIALQFVMYAMGTQFIVLPSEQERKQIAEFYVSAAHQCLRLSAYLSKLSLRSVEAMVFVCYFLMNDNHAPDAWTFGGLLMRQAYAIGLNRDPNTIVPHATLAEKQQRRKVWQAVLFQDTFLTVLLKLPPSATFSDVAWDSLTDEVDSSFDSNGSSNNLPPEISADPMSIRNIAPFATPHLSQELSDRQYIRCMWQLANLVQETVCRPRSLNRPLTITPRDKTRILTAFATLLSGFPPTLTTSEYATTSSLAVNNPRSLRQNLFLRSNYWHCVMIVNADENEDGGVTCDIVGTLEAARVALQAFFNLWEFLQVDAGVWWVFQHRAFEEALLMSRILALQAPPSSIIPSAHDALLLASKADVQRMLQILELVGGAAPEMQKTRTDVLRAQFEGIPW